MSETSGFFEAVYDESEQKYDRVYLAEQFANYFKLFIGNGVFNSPTNQLKVLSSGMNIVISPGWAFINGYWYHNDRNLTIKVNPNDSGVDRTDSVVLRLTQMDRNIHSEILLGTEEITRGDTVYDIKIASVLVPSGASSISQSNITDTRSNESVCGFVKGLMEVETTQDLFAQYNAMFNEWFNGIKNQLSGDLAVRLQLEFDEINLNIVSYKNDVQNYYNQVEGDILNYKNDIQTQISEYNENYQKTLNEDKDLISQSNLMVRELTERDFVIPERSLVFNNLECNIPMENITDTTIIDVYFNQETINEAIRCVVYVESEDGNIKFTAARQPSIPLVATIGVRIR